MKKFPNKYKLNIISLNLPYAKVLIVEDEKAISGVLVQYFIR